MQGTRLNKLVVPSLGSFKGCYKCEEANQIHYLSWEVNSSPGVAG